MNKNDRELARWLFACATGMLEDAMESGVAAQSHRLDTAKAIRCARRLHQVCRDLIAVTETIQVIARSRADRRRRS